MKSLFKDYTAEFLAILNFPKEKWYYFWSEIYKKKFPKIISEYEKIESLDENKIKTVLDNFERRTLDKMKWYWEDNFMKIKHELVLLFKKNAKIYELDRKDFVVNIMGLLAFKDFYYVKTSQGLIILLDSTFHYVNKLDPIKTVNEAILRRLK